MLLKQLKYFIAVVDCRSFTEAAEQNFISQSAISQQIKSLENELGVNLMIRENRNFSLTPAGEYLYRHGQGLLDEFENLKDETIKRGSDSETTLKIGYLKGYGAVELHDAVSEFSKLYPEVSFSIVSGTHEELYHYLINDEVQLLMSDQRRAFNDDYYNYELILADCYVEISTNNPLSNKDMLTLSDLKRTACILISSKDQQNIEKDYYQNTLGFANNFIFSESLDSARLMVASNRGFMPIEAIGTLMPVAPNIKRIPLFHKGKPIQRKFCAFFAKDKTNYYVEEFAEMLRQLFNHN